MPDEEFNLPVVVSKVKTRLSVPLKISIASSVIVLLLGAFLLATRSWERAPVAQLGVWVADVEYEPENVFRERFHFRLTGTTLSGTASYRGARRVIEEARLEENTVSFITRGRDRIGNQQREIVHEYAGKLEGETMQFQLRNVSDGEILLSIEFTALRSD